MLMVERLAAGWTVAGVAAALGTSPRTVRKWRDRFAAEGEAGLRDRSSRPHLSPARLPAAAEAQAWAGSICTSPSMTPRASPTPR
jgi:transposase-like protein